MTTDIATVGTQNNYEISKLNAVQHGILSRHAILPWEESSEYDVLVKQLEDEYAPQGTTEQHLVQELAGVIWRKARLRGAEKATYMKYLNYLLHHTYGDDTPVNIVLLDNAKSNTKQKEAITATATETSRDLKNTNVLLNASNQALAKLNNETDTAYHQALETLAAEDREVWPEWIGEPVSEYSSQKYEANARSLRMWIEKNVEYYERTICELKNRPAIKEQIIGQSFPPEDKVEKLSRYETHLDRKFERTLSMLVKLQDMRKPSSQPPAH